MFHVKHLFANKAGFAAARGALARHLHKIKNPASVRVRGKLIPGIQL
jgi:hypothetical protein